MTYEQLTTKGDYIAYVLKHSGYIDIDTAIPYGMKQNEAGTLCTIYVSDMMDYVVADITAEAEFLHIEQLRESRY